MKAGFYHLLVSLFLALVLVGCSQSQTQVLEQGISVDTSGLSSNSDSTVDASVSAAGKSVGKLKHLKINNESHHFYHQLSLRSLSYIH